MAGKPAFGRISLVGVALMLLVALTLGFGALSGWVLSAAFSGAAAGVPAWAVQLVRLLGPPVCFVPPLLFFAGMGGAEGLYPVRVRGKNPVPLPVLAALFLGAMVLANSLSSLIQMVATVLFGLQAPQLGTLPGGVVARILYFASACVLAPLLEELFFRRAMQGALRGAGRGFAILVTSAAFTLMHTTLWDLPAVFALSLALGYMAEVGRNIWPCILMHALNNLLGFMLLLFRESMDAFAFIAVVVWCVVLVVVGVCAALWAIRHFGLGRRLLPAMRAKRRARNAATNTILWLGMLTVAVYFVSKMFELF